MRYPPHILEEIRTRLPASDVVGRRVKLKKAGREWRGLSPFNAEKSPSFYVNDQKQFYHCFSSGKHGDIFTFLMETEGVSFPEAVERLAGEAGVSLPKMTVESEQAEARRTGALDIMELAALYFEEQLRGPNGGEARAYLDRRGLGDNTQKKFRLGYAGGARYGLRDHLAGKGVERDTMLELGLLATAEGVAVPYDKFRDRVMFPIRDVRGRVVAFGGRAMQAGTKAKYMNSPETPLFHKGRMLYNLDLARKAAHDRARIVAVEGYVDVIAMTLAGFPETVAPLGTALTEDQLALLWRHADEPILCFDGDGAGQRAAFRALDLALPLITTEKSIKFAFLPQGQDPDDLLRTGGPEAIDMVIKNTTPVSSVIFGRHLYDPNDTRPENIAKFRKNIMDDIGKVKDQNLQKRLVQELATRFSKNESQKRFTGKRIFADRNAPPSPRIVTGFNPLLKVTAPVPAQGGRAAKREAMIVASLLAHPELLGIEEEALAALELVNPDAQALRDLLLERAAEAEALEPELMEIRLRRAGLEEAHARLTALITSGDRWMLDPHANPQRLEHTLHQAVILHRQSGALHSELHQAERALAEDGSEANFAWLCDVQQQLAVIAAAEAEAEVSREE